MNELKSILKSVTSIYASPGSMEGWESALGTMTKLVGAETSAYFLVDNETLENQVFIAYGYSDLDWERYEGTGGRELDIRVQHLGNLTPGEVFREFEYIPDKDAYAASEWIQYERNTYGRFWHMAARVSKHKLWSDVISFNRLEKKDAYPDAAKAALHELLPHLSRSAELHRTVTHLENIYGAVLSVLDKLLVGLVILDTKGRTVVTNVAAEQAFRDSGAMKLTSSKRLRAVDKDIDNALQAIIAATADTILQAGASEGGQLVVPGRAIGANLLLDIMPIRDDGLPDSDNIRGVAIFVVDPNRGHILNTKALSKIFSLSAAEGNITDALINGAKPHEIAEERRTSFETVRGQIKSIYRKTGASSASDLVRLAAKASPPIARE